MKDKKEFYRLWYEYLKRSDRYKEFCEWTRAKRKDKSLSPPEKFKKKEDGSAPKEVFIFLEFRDVFVNSFEEWWKFHKDRMEYRKIHSSPKGIEYYNEVIERDFDYCINSFKNHEGRELSLQEFKEAFLKRMEQDSHYFIYLMVNVNGVSIKELEKQFQDILKDQRAKRVLYRQRIQAKPLERYLQVYDLKKHGLKWRDIANKVQSGSTGAFDNVKRALQNDFDQAEMIIKNVEKGIFPGISLTKKGGDKLSK